MPLRFDVIDEDCIRCGLCAERAPENLSMPTASPAAEVFKQPENAEEEEACLDASDYCPMGGLLSSNADSPPDEESPGDAQPTPTPAGDRASAGTTPTTRLESEA